MTSVLILLFMTFFGALGGFFFKKASAVLKENRLSFLVNMGIGGSFYVAGALLNILLLTKLPYSIVFPLTAITYFWTLFISKIWLQEALTTKKIIGVVFILVGCFFLVQ
ncbi:multidrug transporter [Jeotgalibacillus soli]|uniref:Multidrug transporter n=1 Tax=Jeotgalibacillus soli TaxID=889306 RepID=A0A0C2W167_9BACL|nr:multidrug transporter [Jeotgalibacillus soli]KIL49883.1 multidrug transporter [Jeotgalibacillus soli]